MGHQPQVVLNQFLPGGLASCRHLFQGLALLGRGKSPGKGTASCDMEEQVKHMGQQLEKLRKQHCHFPSSRIGLFVCGKGSKRDYSPFVQASSRGTHCHVDVDTAKSRHRPSGKRKAPCHTHRFSPLFLVHVADKLSSQGYYPITNATTGRSSEVYYTQALVEGTFPGEKQEQVP